MENNVIYKKIKIALNLKDQIVMEVFKLGGLEVSRSFCNAINRADTFKDYRRLTDHELDCFLQGLIKYKRGH